MSPITEILMQIIFLAIAVWLIKRAYILNKKAKHTPRHSPRDTPSFNALGICFVLVTISATPLELVDSTFPSSFSTRFGLPMYRFACQTLGAQLRGQLVSGLLLSAILCEGFRGVLLLSKEAFGALFFY
jgi:hypothetical protein